jgi:predicted glycoside hydrolase/deacetylase ChbG (UPF0249 family)
VKLVIRADDYGYTVVHNLGTIETIKNGITTSVDLMLDTPGTEDGIARIKEFPWISVGWHSHFWGRPVLDPSKVPSMVDSDGKFKFRKDRSLRATVKYEDALAECRAEIERCIRLLGRVPDTTNIQEYNRGQNSGGGLSEMEQARKDICDEYGIVYGFVYKYDKHSDRKIFPKEEYKHLGITMSTQQTTAYKEYESKDWNDRRNYDPVRYFVEDEDGILSHEISISAWHPGYLDDYVANESSYTAARPIDVGALCSPALKQWIIDNKIELINHRDALYGTHEYQNYLKVTGSPLAAPNVGA